MIRIIVRSTFLLIILSIFNVEGFSFLSKLSDHSESYTLNTEYYVSQQIVLNWLDSFLFCKSNGLKLAKNVHNEKFDEFFRKIQKSSSRSGDLKLLVDGSDVPNQSVCSVIVNSSTNSFRNITCTNEKHKFLCQSDDDSDRTNSELSSFVTNANKMRSFKRLDSDGEKNDR